MEFSEWITSKYVEWRGDAIGRERTISEFASWIGVSQQVMSNWMRLGGNVPSAQKSVNALVSRYGDEVYEVLGLQVPLMETELDLGDPESVERFIRRWAEEQGYRIEIHKEDDPEDKY